MNELPEVMHDACDGNTSGQVMSQSWPHYSMLCKSCGSISCYADDTTYSCTGSDLVELSDQLSSKYNVMSDVFFSCDKQLKKG